MTDTNIRKTIFLEADRAAVWEYLTQPEHLAKWFHAPKTALAAATNIQETFGLCLGAWIMGDAVRAATARQKAGDTAPFLTAKLALAQVYATHVFPKAQACHSCVIDGSEAILDLSPSDLRTGT